MLSPTNSHSATPSTATSPELKPGTARPPPPFVLTPTPQGATTPSKFSRFQRMFSGTNSTTKATAPERHEPSRDGKTDGSASDTDGSVTSEKKSDKRSSTERKTTSASGEKKEMKRFEVFPDGSHEHHLRSAKRQEKLSDMLRDLIVGKKKGEDFHPVEPDRLSLVSGLVDQIKSDHKLATDKKCGLNNTASLVEKYGKCQEIIGRGAFGIVRISHKVDPKNGQSEQLYAVKEFRRRPSESAKKYQKRLTSEFCISSSLRHPNVIHTLDLLQDSKGDYCEVMEFCAGGDLYTLVLTAGKLEVAEADCFFKQLMRGVEYMHEMGVAHRDLKPENLLLTTHAVLKIADFGNGECFRLAWEKEPHMTAGLCGSAPYIAPEEYTDKEFDPRAVDVWATGVIYMAMRTGRHLWRVAKRGEDEFFEKYLEGRKDEEGYQPIESLHRVSIPLLVSGAHRGRLANENMQARCRNVIYSILDPNPARRITASQVLKSEWGRDIKLCKAGEKGLS